MTIYYLPGVHLCEQWCEPNTTPIGPDGRLPTEETKGECGACAKVTTWLCDAVLPSIQRHGYYVPAGTPIELELAAMREQAGLSDQLTEMLTEFMSGGG